MSSLNRVMLIGRVGKDVEVRTTDNSKVASFTLATSEKFKDRNGERVETTEWHNVQLWGKLADVAEKYIIKGTMLYIEGKLKTEKYTDAQGVEKFFTRIMADRLQLLSKKAAGADVNDDDLPE